MPPDLSSLASVCSRCHRGRVSSIYRLLVVKTTSANMREIRQLLTNIDRAPVDLLISVKHIADSEVRRDLAEAFGRVQNGGVTIAAGRRAGDRSGATVTGADQSSTAGVNMLHSTVVRITSDARSDSGFAARPRLTCDLVNLDFFPANNRFRASTIETREATTSVSGSARKADGNHRSLDSYHPLTKPDWPRQLN